MKTNHLILFVIALSTLMGCDNSTKEGSHDQIIKLPGYFEKGDFSLSEIASDITIIPLSSAVPLPPTTDINCFDSMFYFKDRGGSRLYRFKIDGSFVDVLDKKGQGPEEYMGITDFYVDKAGSIYVNCYRSKKLLVYNSNLTYKSTIPYPKDLSRSNVRWLDRMVVFFPNELGEVSKYDWITTDYKGEILDVKMDPHSGRIRYHGNNSSFLAYEKDSILYRYRNWSDTIFGISGNGSNAKYVYERVFTDGRRMSSLDEIFLESGAINLISNATNPIGKRNINGIYDIGKKLIITYRGEKNESILFDLKNNESKIILDDNGGLARIPNDWLGSGPIDIRNIVKIGTDRYIIDYIDAIKIKSIVQSDSFLKEESTWTEKKNEFQILSANLNENDNPVVILIKLK